MKINIVCVGSIKEKFYTMAIEEYIKRLSKFHKVQIVEVDEEKLSKNYSEADIAKVIVKEGERIISHLKGYIIAMDIEGKKMTSEKFAIALDNLALKSAEVTFVIGGSFGLSDYVKKQANFRLSMSDMTLPHQLFRVVLLEQIYRASTIVRNIPYHK